MALFSFRHSVKTYSPKCEDPTRVARAGQTHAHMRYITRPSAARVVIRERLDQPSDQAQAQMAEQAAEKRKGRVCERFIAALPAEASPEERVALARRFADELTRGTAGYILAVHDKAGNDVRNPHFHLVAFDRHETTGGRGRPRSVVGMARKNAVETWAARWAAMHNDMMQGWGYGPESEISHLSYADRNIDLIPEIHEGPAARHLILHGAQPESKATWRRVDAGQTRAEANKVIREINQLRRQEHHEPTYRLGSGDAGNQNQGNRSRPSFGEDRRRCIPGPCGPESPCDPVAFDVREAERDRRPPWLAGSGSEEPCPLSGGRSPRTPIAPGAPAARPGWPLPRRRPVRRIFRELILLRDTLRARLATLGGRHRSLSSSGVAEVASSQRPPATSTGLPGVSREQR